MSKEEEQIYATVELNQLKAAIMQLIESALARQDRESRHAELRQAVLAGAVSDSYAAIRAAEIQLQPTQERTK